MRRLVLAALLPAAGRAAILCPVTQDGRIQRAVFGRFPKRRR